LISLRTVTAAIVGIGIVGLSVYAGQARTSTLVLGAFIAAAITAVHRWDQTRLVAEVLWLFVANQRSLELIQEVAQAQRLSEADELAEAVVILDAVAEAPETARVAMLEMLHAQARGMIAGTQGDLAGAGQWLQRAAAIAQRRHDRSAFTEITEQLAKFQIAAGDPQAAYLGLQEAVAEGGGMMFRLSRVRAELQMGNAAGRMGDDERAYRHAMEARRLARKWGCHEQQGLACCILALHAMVHGDNGEAHRWTNEALESFSKGGASSAAWVDPLVTAGKVADADGRLGEALQYFRKALGIVATQRVSWGDRSAQAYTVGLRQPVVSYAFQVAYTRCASADDAALDDFAALFSLVNQTNLRAMLRSGASFASQRGLPDAQAINQALGMIELAEADLTGRSQAAGPQLRALYERLETLVSLRFRQTMEGPLEATSADARRWATEWKSHILEINVLIDDATVQIASLWTDENGTRIPAFTTLDRAQVRLLAAMTLNTELHETDPSNAAEMDASATGSRSWASDIEVEGMRASREKMDDNRAVRLRRRHRPRSLA
jgi:tetratricopeptide (TPR) repeat protein